MLRGGFGELTNLAVQLPVTGACWQLAGCQEGQLVRGAELCGLRSRTGVTETNCLAGLDV